MDTKAVDPKLSIGLVVYNEGEFFSSAITDLLSQTYPNFEIIISDDCSTDGTETLCQEIAAKHSNVRYFRNEVRLGGIRNFNRVLKLCQGEYFMWASGHDRWDKNYAAKCISELEQDKNLVLAFSRAGLIDRAGNQAYLEPIYSNTSDICPAKRLAIEIKSSSHATHVYGIFRRSQLEKTSKYLKIPGPDRVLLAEMSLIGGFIQIQKPLFKMRLNEGLNWKKHSYYKCARQEVYKHITSNPLKAELIAIIHPAWRICSYLKIIFLSKLKLTEKLFLLVNIPSSIIRAILIKTSKSYYSKKFKRIS